MMNIQTKLSKKVYKEKVRSLNKDDVGIEIKINRKIYNDLVKMCRDTNITRDEIINSAVRDVVLMYKLTKQVKEVKDANSTSAQ